MRIDVYADTICPWCHIGKRRLEQALAAWSGPPPQVVWRPFQLNADMPPGGMDRRIYLARKFGGAARAARIYDGIAANGARENIPFAFDAITVTPNTVDSHRLVHFAGKAGRADAVVEALFRAYFIAGRNIGDRAELVAIAGQAGLDGHSVAAYLKSGRDIDRIQAEDRRARRLGIEGVPCFIVNGRYALSGAQAAEAFRPLFDIAAAESAADESAADESAAPARPTTVHDT